MLENRIFQHCAAQPPGIAVARVVDPTQDGGSDTVRGQRAIVVGAQQILESPAVVDDLAPLQPAMRWEDDEAQEGDGLP